MSQYDNAYMYLKSVEKKRCLYKKRRVIPMAFHDSPCKHARANQIVRVKQSKGSETCERNFECRNPQEQTNRSGLT